MSIFGHELEMFFSHVRYWRFPDIGEWRGPEDNDAFLPRASEIEWDDRTPGTPPMTPNHFSSHDHDSTADYSHEDSTDLDPCSDSVLESARNYDSDGPCSPSLSNKGVPNMFPVTESDFQNNLVSDGEDSPLPYGSPLPFNRRQLDCTSVECNPASASPTSPGSPAEPYARPFAFYHRDVRLGQTQQFSTFGRKF
ncbi:uncharacterized protein LOC123508081 [Portunus trituberculatus]|nr:uncharacterized protein LOC123508081 [Portunus trituberculatus]